MMQVQKLRNVRRFRSDRGGEFNSHEFDEFLNEKGIFRERSALYEHQQNGCAERINHTLREKAETMCHNSGTPANWWEYAMETAMHVYNRIPLERTKWKTPFQNMFGIIPNVSYFRTFGCLAWVWTPEEIRRNKLEPRSQPMTFIGYVRGTKGWLFMQQDNTEFIGSHAKFNELTFLRKDVDKSKLRPPRTMSSWDTESSDDEFSSKPNQTLVKNQPQKEIYHSDSEDQELEVEKQCLTSSSDDDSEQLEKEVPRDIEPKTSTKGKGKQIQKKEPPPVLRRSSRIKATKNIPDSTYGNKTAAEILKQKDTEFEKEIKKAETDSNKAVKLLLSKAI